MRISFLERAADVNVKDNQGEATLMIASKYGHTQILDLLKAHGATE